MAKEIRAFWDIKTLTDYISLKKIPRGLRIKKFPTFEFTDEESKLEWTYALSTCSFKLMNIIIASKQKELDWVQSEMALIQKDLTAQQGAQEYASLDGQLNKRLDKLERNVISIKNDKRIRDQLDYDSNKIYIWKKPSFQSYHPRRSTPKKRVSFSDTEGERTCDTLAATGSDSSSDGNHTFNKHNSMPLNQGRHGRNKKKGKKREKHGEVVKDTEEVNTTRYQLRGWK